MQKLVVVRQSKSTQHRPIRIHSQGHHSQHHSPPACSHRRSRRHSRRRAHRRTGAWAWARGSRQQRRQTGREAGTGPFLACFCCSLCDWWEKSASLGVLTRYLYLLFVLFSPIRPPCVSVFSGKYSLIKRRAALMKLEGIGTLANLQKSNANY